MTTRLATLLSALALCLPLPALAAPDAGGPSAHETRTLALAMAADYEQDTATDALRADPAAWPLLYSAARCEAQARLDETVVALERHPRSRALLRAAATARADLDRAEETLAGLGLTPLDCAHARVAQIVECLAAAAPLWCEVNQDVAAYVRAVEAGR